MVAAAIGPSKVTTGISDLSGSGDTCVGSGEQRFLMLETDFRFVNGLGHSVLSEVRRFQNKIEAQGRPPDQPVLMLPANWPDNFGNGSYDVSDDDVAVYVRRQAKRASSYP